MALRFVQLLIIFVLALATYKRVLASDPDILSYYVVPENNKVDANFSIYTGFQDIFDDVPGTLNITKAALAEFPALNGQNVSYAMLKYPANEDSPDWKEFGLGHCQYNSYANLPAYADSAFRSANAGTVSVLIYMFVFGTGIDNAILAKSLKTMLVPKEAQGWPHHS
ncbi:unnamed protein product [Prunus armeniaca]|uniref:Inhibitor I9 domain-containing protein n=1 Tax=Prunus armeniaca TaxID=36596 RepID=A0A6J5WBC2_PRUAR|nr:unnamed protein product [Prunus armeniaca]